MCMCVRECVCVSVCVYCFITTIFPTIYGFVLLKSNFHFKLKNLYATFSILID